MTPIYPTVNPEARIAIRKSKEELLERLFSGFKRDSALFDANPTAENWQAMVRSHAKWDVALRAEEKRE
jgi:hypothetical protein